MSLAVVSSFTAPQAQTQLSSDDYRQSLMIEYAYNTYQYVITPGEATEILEAPYWDDVDSFCQYMLEVNFGEAVPGASNVKLPSTMRIYTDEEIEAGIFDDDDEDYDENYDDDGDDDDDDEDEQRPSTREEQIVRYEIFASDYIEDSNERADSAPVVVDISNDLLDFEGEVPDEGMFDGECLPTYTHELLPAYYSCYPVRQLPDILSALRDQAGDASGREAGATMQGDIPRNVVVEDAYEVTTLSSEGRDDDKSRDEETEAEIRRDSRLDMMGKFRARVDRRWESVRSGLARGLKSISPKKALSRTREITSKLQGRKR